MRIAAGPAWGAVRPIAHICWRVDMACEILIRFDVRVAKPGKVRVNPAVPGASSGKGPARSSTY